MRSGSIRSGGASSSSSSDGSGGSDGNGGDSAKGERGTAVADPAGGSCAPSLSVLPLDRRFNLASATWGVPWRAVVQKFDSGGFTAEPFVLPAGVEGRFPWFQGGALPSYIEVRGGARIRACVAWHDSKSRTVVLDGGGVVSGAHEDTSITMPLVGATLNVALWPMHFHSSKLRFSLERSF